MYSHLYRSWCNHKIKVRTLPSDPIYHHCSLHTRLNFHSRRNFYPWIGHRCRRASVCGCCSQCVMLFACLGCHFFQLLKSFDLGSNWSKVGLSLQCYSEVLNLDLWCWSQGLENMFRKSTLRSVPLIHRHVWSVPLIHRLVWRIRSLIFNYKVKSQYVLWTEHLANLVFQHTTCFYMNNFQGFYEHEKWLKN